MTEKKLSSPRSRKIGGKDPNRITKLSIGFSDEDYAVLRKTAHNANMQLASWAREQLIKASKKWQIVNHAADQASIKNTIIAV